MKLTFLKHGTFRKFHLPYASNLSPEDLYTKTITRESTQRQLRERERERESDGKTLTTKSPLKLNQIHSLTSPKADVRTASDLKQPHAHNSGYNSTRSLQPNINIDISRNFTKSSTCPWVFFVFFKLHKWYQIAQSITYFCLNSENILTLEFPRVPVTCLELM